MAESSGLQHLSAQERKVLQSSTYGFGQLLREALRQKPRHLIIGIGGSATSEGGIGMATALGYRFLDKNGKTLPPIGKNLHEINKILPPKLHPIPQDCRVSVLCDVNNPLYGPRGAAPVFAAQKGASASEIQLLDQGLEHLAKLIARDLGVAVQQLPVGGAAGGLGAGLVAFAQATLRPGIETILEMVDFQNLIQDSDVIITGEGKIDAQTGGGKLIQGICQAAALRNVPVIALCGSLHASPEDIQKIGLKAAFSILTGPIALVDALPQTARMLEETAEHLFRAISLTKL
jgi:glycerate kinase